MLPYFMEEADVIDEDSLPMPPISDDEEIISKPFDSAFQSGRVLVILLFAPLNRLSVCQLC